MDIMKGEGHNLGVDNVVVSGYKTMLVRAWASMTL